MKFQGYALYAVALALATQTMIDFPAGATTLPGSAASQVANEVERLPRCPNPQDPRCPVVRPPPPPAGYAWGN